MKKERMNYVKASLAVLLLIVVATFLPQYYSSLRDTRNLNKVTLQDREKVFTSNREALSPEVKIQVLTEDAYNAIAFSPVLKTKDKVVNEKKLVSGLTSQLKKFMKSGILPEDSLSRYRESLIFADLYQIYSSRKDKSTLVWYLRFGDNETYDYRFCVDAYDYTIYGAEIRDARLAELMKMEMDPNNGEQLFANTEKMVQGVEEYYGATRYEVIVSGEESSDSETGYYNYQRWSLQLGDTSFYMDRWMAGYLVGEGIMPGISIGIDPIIQWMGTLEE